MLSIVQAFDIHPYLVRAIVSVCLRILTHGYKPLWHDGDLFFEGIELQQGDLGRPLKKASTSDAFTQRFLRRVVRI